MIVDSCSTRIWWAQSVQVCVMVSESECVSVYVPTRKLIGRYTINKGHSVWLVCVRSTNHSYFVNQLPSRPPKPLIEAGSTINLQIFKMPCPSLPEVSRTGGSGGLQQFTGRLCNTLCLRHFAKSEIMKLSYTVGPGTEAQRSFCMISLMHSMATVVVCYDFWRQNEAIRIPTRAMVYLLKVRLSL